MKQRCLFLLFIAGSSLHCGGRDVGFTFPGGPLNASTDSDVLGCGDDATVAPPKLECTGLYADWSTKTLASGVRAYAPSTPLWSDGADKSRWVYLPSGTTIDASIRTDWVFPVGTKFWKEFRVGGRRIETRLLQKIRAGKWVTAAYAWTSDGTSTFSSMGGDQSDVDTGGAEYHIATQKECGDCHKGRPDRVLGFEEISLGGANAEGLTLSVLVAEGRLSPPPPSIDVPISDDGTGAAAPALGWMHVNCGVTCHNRNPDALGSSSRLFLRLDPAELEAKPASAWDVLRTTLRVTAHTPPWEGLTRVVPGVPDSSLLMRVISSRGEEQMPPIGTHLIDRDHVDAVRTWIGQMKPDTSR